jgi:uncharacterized protein YbjT (DUF2867 family)
LVHSDAEHILGEVETLNLVNLRSPFFFENLFYFLLPMREQGVLRSPMAPDALIDMASTREVANAAVRLLLALDFSGKSVIELHGQSELSLAKIAGIIGKVLDRPFPVERASREADIEGMMAAGMSRDFAILMNDAWEAISRGPVRREQPTTESRVPSGIEDFVREQLVPAILAPAFPPGSAASN